MSEVGVQPSRPGADRPGRQTHFILIPDSFKGTFSSATVCDIMADAIRRHVKGARITSIPVADGGEGSVDAFLAAAGGEKKTVTVSGPYGKPIEGFYGLLPDGTAVIEMAAAAGLPQAGQRRAVEKTTTYGVGELLLAAAAAGAQRLVVGLGGSATNDGGCGAAAACGVRFLNARGQAFLPRGESLKDIARIDSSGFSPRLRGLEITTMCDIDNPLTGEQGAAAIFGPQKGADPDMVRFLDQGLAHLAERIRQDLGQDVETLAGSGAAGGMGGGMVAFFGSRLEMGIETVLNTTGFDQRVRQADFVFTGEGKIDSQSLRGKTVVGVARRAKRYDVPVLAFVGDVGDELTALYEEGLAGIFSINRVAVPFAEAKKRAASDLWLTVDNLLRLLVRLGLFDS